MSDLWCEEEGSENGNELGSEGGGEGSQVVQEVDEELSQSVDSVSSWLSEGEGHGPGVKLQQPKQQPMQQPEATGGMFQNVKDAYTGLKKFLGQKLRSPEYTCEPSAEESEDSPTIEYVGLEERLKAELREEMEERLKNELREEMSEKRVMWRHGIATEWDADMERKIEVLEEKKSDLQKRFLRKVEELKNKDAIIESLQDYIKQMQCNDTKDGQYQLLEKVRELEKECKRVNSLLKEEAKVRNELEEECRHLQGENSELHVKINQKGVETLQADDVTLKQSGTARSVLVEGPGGQLVSYVVRRKLSYYSVVSSVPKKVSYLLPAVKCQDQLL